MLFHSYVSGFIAPLLSVSITCGIKLNGIVVMTPEVLHNSCNMYEHDLPDMYA